LVTPQRPGWALSIPIERAIHWDLVAKTQWFKIIALDKLTQLDLYRYQDLGIAKSKSKELVFGFVAVRPGLIRIAGELEQPFLSAHRNDLRIDARSTFASQPAIDFNSIPLRMIASPVKRAKVQFSVVRTTVGFFAVRSVKLPVARSATVIVSWLLDWSRSAQIWSMATVRIC
jgi:hypothetical protein